VFLTVFSGDPNRFIPSGTRSKPKRYPLKKSIDLFAVRIIVDVPVENRKKPSVGQVYSIVTDVHTPIPERLKDWITTPKSNGYESLHTTVIGPKGNL
jgi:guanosine-3',5'-bis(diphosphate) 3'-pyrophosphohydrolase